MKIENVERPTSLSIDAIFSYFQRLFIMFWIFSFLGHYIEIIWIWVNHLIFNYPMWIPSTPTILPLAPPYGIGVVVVVLFSLPLIKYYKLNPLAVFVSNFIITAIVEYLCAAFLVFFVGYNQFWDYSNQPFNINGYICLKNSVAFGIAVTLFLYYIYPAYQKFIQRFNQKQLDIIFWVMYFSYAIDLIYLNFK
ncbi:MAG: hypothetical protein PWQ10_678 [Patescibacteria group bacterium]|nr:hypothetical protein [Patescibacteria group bacterium]